MPDQIFWAVKVSQLMDVKNLLKNDFSLLTLKFNVKILYLVKTKSK